MSRFISPTSLRLPDERNERHATWLEIFFDLIFSVIVLQLSDRLSNNLTLIGLLQCTALFIPSMWTWVSYTVFAARFDNNDGLHWLMTFIIMFAGAVMAIQIPTALENGGTGFSIGFLISQISLLLLYLRPLYDKTAPKNMMYLYIIGFGLAGIFWIISLFFDPPEKYIFWSLGMLIYLITPWIGRKKILSKAPLDTTYIPERFGAFTVIILGQIIVSVVFGLQSANWHASAVITSMMAFAFAILIWGQYYRFTQIADYKCTLGSGQIYIYSHIPLIISLIIIGVCSQKLISSQELHRNEKNIFCFSIILYLSSFYLLQYIAIKKYQIRGLVYLGGVFAILSLFYLHSFSPMTIMSGIVLIFIALFAIQYRLGCKHSCA
ncbi:MAG: low temperature requirement protein A [Parachlamydiaceae bacterium]|nr:low temperature requirement protein A [Parachlamydiaceae bacterium]